MPRHPLVTEFVMRFYAMELFLGEASGIPDLDLANELRRSCRYGLNREPRSAGETFVVGGQRFDVLWPPAELTAGMSVHVRRALDAFEGLAAKEPMLRAALDRVRESELLDQNREMPTTLEQGQNPLNEVVDDAETWSDDEPDSLPTMHIEPAMRHLRMPSHPYSRTEDVHQAARLFGRAANYMSLVFATPRRDFVSWGDVPLSIARPIARAYATPTHPQIARAVVLAPHHGSQGPAPSLGLPFLCVAQNGRGLHDKWAAKHEPCDGILCLSTDEEGDLNLTTSPHWW